MPRTTCFYCGENADYICERCLRCEHCDAKLDQQRDLSNQHLGKWLWHRGTQKGVQLQALAVAGHAKGDNKGKAEKIKGSAT